MKVIIAVTLNDDEYRKVQRRVHDEGVKDESLNAWCARQLVEKGGCPVDHARVAESGDSALLWTVESPNPDCPWDDVIFKFCPGCGAPLT
jgi:hypothetical protein